MSTQPAANPTNPEPTPATAGTIGRLAGLNGSPNPASTNRLPSARKTSKGARLLTFAAAAILLVAGGGGAAWYYFSGSGTKVLDVVTHTVRKEALELTIVEKGSLESAENSDVYCRVKSSGRGNNIASSIRWVIDAGTFVKRGQTLVELDDSSFHEQYSDQKIKTEQSLAAWVQAQEAYEITLSLNASDIQLAEVKVDLAQIDLTKYVEGDYEQQRKELLGKIKVAQSNLDMWRERTSWSDRMFKLGYYTGSQAQSEKAKMESSEIDLRKLQEDLNLLDKYTKERQLLSLRSELELAKQALIRAKKTADSKAKQAYTERDAKQKVYENELEKLQDIAAEIRKCKIVSPQEGMVVYYIPESSRFGSSSRQVNIAVNETVSENQRLMRIPNLKKMQVDTRVHEAVVARVRGEIVKHTGFGEVLRAGLLTMPDATARLLCQHGFLEMRPEFYDLEHVTLYGGQQARVRVDSAPDRVLKGHVKSVATVASSNDYMSDVKVYQTIVTIDDDIEGLELRPGMSAEVTILADRKPEPVLTIPLDAIVGNPSMGRNRKCLVLKPGGGYEERDIEVGMSNDKVAEVRKGLEENEQIIRDPRRILSEVDKARLYGVSAGKSNDWGKAGGKGKGKAGPDGGLDGGPPPGFEGKGKGGPGGGKGKGKGKPMPMDDGM